MMTELNQIYRCNICGNIVEVEHEGIGTLVCCNQEMELLKEVRTAEGLEKHIPVIKKIAGGIVVKVGSIAHPMEEKHYIEFIELFADNQIYKQFLKPGDKPEATFKITAKTLSARAYCNIHGLWKK